MSPKKNGSTEDKVIEVLDESGLNERLIRLSSGVVLRAKQAPPLTLVKVMAAFPRPKPPTWFNPQMGREMENPDDPDYIERLKDNQTEQSNAVLTALILFGTELVEVPKGLPGPDKNDWVDEYAEIGLPMRPNSKSWRYLTWVTFKAVKNENDLIAIRDAVGRLSGVPEDAVQSAETFSRGNKDS